MDDPVATHAVAGSELSPEGTRVLTLNRPERANAVDLDLARQLLDWLRLSAADGCRALVIAGAGRNFCGGFDFGDVESTSSGDILERFVLIEQALQLLRRAPFVSVALVQGAAFGAGADLAVACTYRVGTSRARFRFPGFGFGVALGTRHLVRVVGFQNARDILLRNRQLDATEALSLGLLTGTGDDGTLQAIAEELLSQTRGLSPEAVRSIHSMTAEDDASADMNDLVRSVAEPGFHARLERYRARG